ncbi:hypothetical protein MUU75_01955 [Pseudoxanthomonas mexicana]|nr:hypothetical protein [Pseudoxanthomonas mexicana]UOV05520.1 hypothetical protein MUU75_01955 [Pseudoxanthomonas mexicana]
MLPDYIDDGLRWLIAQLKRKEDDVDGKMPIKPDPAAETDAAEAAEAGQ